MDDFYSFQKSIIQAVNHVVYQQNRLNVKFEKLEKTLEIILREENDFKIPIIDFYDTADICRILNVTPRTVQRYRTKKLIPYFRYNHKVYYPKKEFMQCLEQNIISPKSL